MERDGIISRVDGPTPWVNPLVVVEKKNGDLRLCLDPKDLNTALKVEPALIPSPDEMLSQLNKNKFFSVIDMKCGFWHVVLDKDSAKLCTFSSPFGNYCFNRLPFGLSVSPEIFTKKVQEVFSGLKGVIIYFDDAIVFGSTLEEHNRHLQSFLERARTHNVRFNSQKCQFCQEAVEFVGLKVSRMGVSMTTKHVDAIKNLAVPQSKKDLKHFLGLVKYLHRFLPHASELTTSLRELAKDQCTWEWKQEHQTEFLRLKELLTSAPMLRYFDPSVNVVIQADASQFGLGACLLQEGQPICFASRVMNQFEKNYSQIEKELLAICFACDRFHYYIYGRSATVQSDHKPLQSLFKQDLAKIPARLRRMRLQLFLYQLDVIYIPGKDLILADFLSRNLGTNDSEGCHNYVSDKYVHAVASNISGSQQILQKFRDSTALDETLQQLLQFVANGWPRSVPPRVQRYAAVAHLISNENGILLLQDKIIVPTDLRRLILEEIHCDGHLGEDKCKAKARQRFYWPGMSSDIQNYIKSCSECIKYHRSNQREPLKPYPTSDRPWQRVGSDVLTFGGRDYLVIYDSYSKWIELDLLQGKSAETLINIFRDKFSKYGIIEELVCDNMPYNSNTFREFAREFGLR
uniref:RNA-directed DNA polymerase n=1 Tax=Lygus hesperus TaxID=30085 RepID=A0A0A9Y5C8_LYGHE